MVPLWALVLAVLGSVSFTCVNSQTINCAQEKKDVVIIMDESNSINETDFEFMRNFVKSITGCFSLSETQIKLALVTFARPTTIRFDFNEFVDDVTGAQDLIMNFTRNPINFATWTHRAFQTIRETLLQESRGDRPDVNNTIILITDGPSTFPEVTIDEYLKFDFSKNEFFVIGVTDMTNITELEIIASDPIVDHLFLPKTFEDLAPLKDTVINFACPPCDPPCQNEGVCFRPNNTCQCSEVFAGDRCEDCAF